ncbi:MULTISPECIES: PAS domain-containing protein [unclassified Streptomyces]|uniref:helix-turn-helix transcriptional regulator n=1 Tax=unclassified Streptomyces TaxID=2593676 RepID=UPI000DC32841|nr:PAS domain-containing protein [Streptomyces sp. PsTaAH-130]MYU05620.1 PAS domain-containing protein [Streptomyces sp. SID8366]MYU61237.1 PAS domain-containing protein [Streptomyces sp. SID69]RAJ63669.1 PAS domain S-box-containing protein [Streptomyces sp. PsTaAH-130]
MDETERTARLDETPGPPGRNPFGALAELTPAAAFMRDGAGRYVWANHAYAHLYGTTRDAVIGRHLSDLDEPANASRFLAMDRQVLTDSKPLRHALTYRRPDGSSAHAAGYRFPVRWGDERCVAGIYVDVTDYVRALDQRHRAEADLRALRDHSGLACVRLAPDGRVSEAGTATAEILRLRLSDLTGLHAASLLADTPERSALSRVWDDLITGRRRSARASAVLVDGEGWQRRARIRLTTVGSAAPGVTGVWAVATHLGRRQLTQPTLTAAQVRIVALLAAGRSNADIAEELHLSRQTLDYHLSRLRVLLEAPTRPALVARAYVLGILSPRTWPPRSPTAAHPSSPV